MHFPLKRGLLALSLIGSLASLAGCGTAGPVCSLPALPLASHGVTRFSADPVTPLLTVYPGDKQAFDVAVTPVSSLAADPVTISAIGLPDGFSITPGATTVGNSAHLTLTAADTLLSGCFTGAYGIYSAYVPVTLRAQGPNGYIDMRLGVAVELSNPDYTPPATNLPVIQLSTTAAAPIDSKEDYITGSMQITDPTKASNKFSGTMEIKGHGNSTWDMPKKAYRVKLDSKSGLLGMKSSKNWILLANFDDKTLLRNDLAFHISQTFGMAWTPSTQFAEVYLNGKYEGLYELAEHVEVDKNRLNISEMDDTDIDGTNLTGGYLGEVDSYRGETLNFTSPLGLPIGLDDPDPPVAQQAEYFTSEFTAAENSLSNSSAWPTHWDQDSLVKWFLIQEFMGNGDADDWSSEYFYKPRGDDRFYMGPVWDLDISSGNVNYHDIVNPAVPWVSTHAAWYKTLLKDPAFMAAVKAEWQQMSPQMTSLPDYLNTRAAALSQGAGNNFGRWPILGVKVWPNSEAAGSYTAEVDFLKSWMNQRKAYMDRTYGQ